MKMVIITHPLCTDAMTAAHVLNLAWPDATVMFFTQRTPPPVQLFVDMRLSCEDMIVFVDVAYSAEYFDALDTAVMAPFWVLDHHDSAYEALRYTKWGENMRLDRSGAGLALDFVDRMGRSAAITSGMRRVVAYVQDWDLQHFRLLWSKPITLYINSTIDVRDYAKARELLDTISKVFDRAGDTVPTTMVSGGMILQRMLRARVRAASDNIMVRGGIPYVNIDQHLADEALPVFSKGYPFAVGWWMESDGRIGLSVRADNESGAALHFVQKLGGGGKISRCGANISIQTLTNLLSEP